MRNLIAILKDSFREAVDTKVVYVMIGLAGLVTLAILSLSFEPLPAAKMMEQLLTGRLPGPDEGHREARRRGPPQRGPGSVTVKNVAVIKGKPDSPNSEYRVTLALAFADEEEAGQVRKALDESLADLRQRFTPFEELALIRVTDIRPADNPSLPPGEAASARDVYLELDTAPTPSTSRIWPHKISLFFGALPLDVEVPLALFLFFTSLTILQIGGWVTVLVSVILTAFFIPNMLRKGTVDLLLVKPVSRSALLLYKYLGGLTFIFVSTAVTVVGIWLALGLRSGIWANGFLLTIFIITFFFAILYSVSTLFGVLTRSAVVAILVTCGAWFVFFIVGTVYQVFDDQRKAEEAAEVPQEQRWGDNTFGKVVRAIHFVTPRTADLNRLMQQLLLSEFLTGKLSEAAKVDRTSLTWGESLAVSCAFVVLMLGLSCWWFATKDY